MSETPPEQSPQQPPKPSPEESAEHAPEQPHMDEQTEHAAGDQPGVSQPGVEAQANNTDVPPPAGELSKDECNWALYCHLSALSALVGIPFGNVLGPLLIWQIKRDTMPVVEKHGKESLNFQITMSIGIVALGLATIVLAILSLIPIVGCVMILLMFVAIFGMLAIVVLDLVLVILACIAASKGEFYTYPWTWRVIR